MSVAESSSSDAGLRKVDRGEAVPSDLRIDSAANDGHCRHVFVLVLVLVTDEYPGLRNGKRRDVC